MTVHRSVCHAGADWKPYRGCSWTSLLDWAVYHAPGWSEWQAWRGTLVGTPMKDRCSAIEQYWEMNLRDLQTCVRVANLLRSLRGQFTDYPELRLFLDEVNDRLSEAMEAL